MKRKTLFTWFMFLVVVGTANFVLPSTVRFFSKAYDCPSDPTASASGTPCNNMSVNIQLSYNPDGPVKPPLSSELLNSSSSISQRAIKFAKQPLVIFVLIALSGTALIALLFHALHSE